MACKKLVHLGRPFDNVGMAAVACFLLALASIPPSEAAALFADKLVGARAIDTPQGRYAFDSVGLVRAAFMTQGIDLFQAPAALDAERSGVDIVYQFAALYGKLHMSRRPRVGDLVFFGHTRDADRDGEADSISHIGIVTAVAADGTARVVTASGTGIVAVSLNRLRPKDAVDELEAPLNSRLYLGTNWRAPRLTSELFYTFATLQQ